MGESREYETLYIIAPELNEEEQIALRGKVVDTIKNAGGEIVKDEVWGKRKLAFPIKKKTEGVYVLVRSRAEGNLPGAIGTFVKRTPDVVRHLTTVVTDQQVHEEARQVEAAAKRAELARVAAEEAEKRAAEREAQQAAALEAAAAQEAEAAQESVLETTVSEQQPGPETDEQREAVGE